MSAEEMSTYTVIELRRMAREMGVPLSGGLSKAGIIERLQSAIVQRETAAASTDSSSERQITMEEAIADAITADQKKTQTAAPRRVGRPRKNPLPEEAVPAAPAAETQPAAQAPAPAPAPAVPAAAAAVSAPAPAPSAAAPKPAPAAPGNGMFVKVWSNPRSQYSAPRQSNAGPRATSAGGSWNNAGRPVQQQDPAPRTGTVRPVGYTPHFGPGAPQNHDNDREEGQEYGGFRRSAPASRSFGPERQSFSQEQTSNEAPRAFTPRPAFEQTVQDIQPTQAQLMASLECKDGSGFLEIHPEGYGFLRVSTMLPSNKDIYISMAQIRRFGLRSGDLVSGKIRPQREGDKFAAMLYITSVNEQGTEELVDRPSFDDLTPAYPEKRISMDSSSMGRIIDLTVPMGFGQRALLLCPPEVNKQELLVKLANTLTESNPEAVVMMLLIEELPEDVTLIRQMAKCPVMASTFDMTPESHFRLADLVTERAQRLAELGKDVIVVADSLTRLSKIFTNSNNQQGRAIPGMVNPTSLYRAKKLFGAARRLTEGGSLTIIGAMNVQNGNKVDDTVVEEFRSTATTVMVFDSNLAAAGMELPLNLTQSVTKRPELFSTPEQMNGLKLLQTNVISQMQPMQCLQQLQSFVEKTADNSELITRLINWVALAKS